MAIGGTLGALVVEITTDLSNLNTGLKQANANVQKSSGEILKTASQIGRTMSIMGLAITGAFGVAVKEASDFSQGIADVLTLVEDVDGTIRENFIEGVDELSTEFGEASGQLTKSLFDIQSATGDSADAINKLRAATKLAVGGNSNLEASTAGLLTLLESYGDQLRGAADGADLLFQAQVKARATVGELADASGLFLPIARQLNINVEELFSTFSSMTVALGNTKESATALRGVLNGFIKPTEELTELTAKWGFATAQQALKELGLLGVLKKLKGVEQARLGDLFPRIEGLKGLFAVLKDLENVEEDVLFLREREGAVDEALAIQSEEFNRQVKIATQNFLSFARTIGLILLPVLNDFFKQITPLLEDIKNFAKEHEKLTKFVIGLTASFGLLFLALGPLLIVLPGLVTLLTSTAVAITAIKTALTGLSGIAAAAFAGWGLGRLLGDVTGLDEALSGEDGFFTKMFIALETAKTKWEMLKKIISLVKDEAIAAGLASLGIKVAEEEKRDDEEETANNEIDLGEIVIEKKAEQAKNEVNIVKKKNALIRALEDQFNKITIKAEANKEKTRQMLRQQTYNQFKDLLAQASAESKTAANILKAVRIGEAIANTATAVTQALAVFPGPLGITWAGIVSAMGAAQIALISGVKFATGTDTVPAMLSPGETVIPRTFADAIRQGRLTLSGPADKIDRNNNSEIEVNFNMYGDINTPVELDQLKEDFGDEVKNALKGTG